MEGKYLIIAVAAAFLLDLLLGDPYSLPHPVRIIGRIIAKGEKLLRRLFTAGKSGEITAGIFLVIIVCGISFIFTKTLLIAFGRISSTAAFVAEAGLCYQLLAARSLSQESRKVYEALKTGDIAEARQYLSMIVGRDTKKLEAEGIIKAAVETVAENTSDGVIAPLFYMMLGGAPLAMLYKSINTLDSMVGYKNERYKYFGLPAAKLDDLANYIPARIAGLLMVAAAFVAGYDGKGSWKIFCRDRLKHASPNSAHTEAACAGALDVELAGNASYQGVVFAKPTIGDPVRKVELEDILHANRLMYVSSVLALLIFAGIRWLLS